MRRIITTVVTVLLVTSCNPTSKQAPEDGSARRDAGQTIGMQSLDSSLQNYYRQNSGLEEPARVVVRDAQTWSALWTRIVANSGPKPPVPSIDFSREMLIVAAMGTRGSGGYSIRVGGVSSSSTELVATVIATSPGRSCPTTQAITSPVDIVRVPSSKLLVRFVEQQVVNECG